MNKSESLSEPPERSSVPNIFLVGRDSHGHWVAQDQRGLCGGLFVDRSKAIHFAMEETGKRPQAIVMVPGVLELDMSGRAGTAPQRSSDLDAARERRAA
jgi:hypothetical protein